MPGMNTRAARNRPGREPLTSVCSTCGAVFFVDEGHACPGPRGRVSTSRALLRLAA